MRAYRRFLAILAVSMILSLGAVAVINLTIDVNGVYHGESSRQRNFIAAYVRELIASPRGLVMVPFERAVKLELAKVSRARCAVLGSSVAMTMAADSLPAFAEHCPSAVNLAVSGAGLEDLILFAGQVAQVPDLRTVIIVVSPWQLRYGSDQRWRDFATLYREARHLFSLAGGAAESSLPKVSNLINARYLQRNLEALTGHGPTAAVVAVSPDDGNLRPEDAVTRPTGQHVYSHRFRVASAQTNALADGAYALADQPVDSGALADLDRVVAGLAARGKTVELVLMPYHPLVWTCPNPAVCAMLTRAEDAVRRLGASRGVTVIGSYQPQTYGLTIADYHDSMHLRVEALPKVRQ